MPERPTSADETPAGWRGTVGLVVAIVLIAGAVGAGLFAAWLLLSSVV